MQLPLAPRRRRRRARRGRWPWLVSALLHGAVIAAVLLRLPTEKPPEQPLPSPDVALVFESGGKTAAIAEKDAPKRDAPTQSPPRSQPAPAPPKAVTAPPPAPVPPPLPKPEPPPPPTPAPVPAPAPLPAPPPRPLPPVPEPAPVPQPAPQPLPPIPEAQHPIPRPPPPLAVAPPRAVPARPAPRPPATQNLARGFPMPMMRSWTLGAAGLGAPSGGGTTASASERAAAAALRSRSQSDTHYDVRGAENLGPDWMNEFSAWVEAHLRYPEQAAENQEDGTNEVTIHVTRDGHVVGDVPLGERSGSTWLDVGTQSLFRGRHLPPFPPDALDQELTIQVTIHYIIVR